MSRLFYPILFGVTAALAAMLWLRHGFDARWLTLVDARVARAQAVEPPAAFDRPDSPPRAAAGTVPIPAAGTVPIPAAGAVPIPAAGTVPIPAAGTVPIPAAGALPPPGPAARRRSNLESLEISAPILMQSTKVIARIRKTEVILAGDIMPRVEEAFKHVSPHYDPSMHEQLREQLLRQILQEVIDRKLIVADMKKDIPTDKLPEFQKHIEQHFTKTVLPALMKEEKVKTERELAELLKTRGSALESVKREFIEQALFQEWMKKEATDDDEVTHDEMLRYYYQHFDEYKYAAKARFETLHASFKKHRDRQEAWRLICELGNQVMRGRAFGEVAKARSEGLHSDRGGLWDWTTEGSLRSKVLDTAVFSLPIGRLSDVLEDKTGFTIIRVIERKQAGVKSFRDTQAEIQANIKEDRRQKHRKQALTKFLEKNRPSAWTIFDDPPAVEQAAPPTKQPVRR